MAGAKNNSRNPWFWIPTLYVAEGMPNALVATVSVMLYSDLGVSNAATAFFTSLLYLPWVIKPLWSPVVDILKTRRQWIWATQFFLGATLAGIALMIPAPHFVSGTIIFFALLAFASATHDIAADGFYMLAPTEREQAYFVGWRSIFYNLGKIAAQGGLVFIAGKLLGQFKNPTFAWSSVFAIGAIIFFGLGIYHRFILPRPAVDVPKKIPADENFFDEFL